MRCATRSFLWRRAHSGLVPLVWAEADSTAASQTMLHLRRRTLKGDSVDAGIVIPGVTVSSSTATVVASVLD